jgi:replicative DNA helicase
MSKIPPARTNVPLILSGQVPYSEEAEEAVIGSIIVNSEAFLGVASFLQADDFYFLRHTYIWEAFLRISRRESAINYITVLEELRATGHLDEIGGPGYLTQVSNSMPTSMDFMAYARIVQDRALRRRGMVAADEFKDHMLDLKRDGTQAYLDGLRAIDAAQRVQSQSYLPGALSIAKYDTIIDDLSDRFARGEMIGYPLPDKWFALSENVPFILPGNFIVVSGPHGSGKSAFLESWGEHLAGLGLPVEYIHTEMSQADMLHRRKARHSNIPFYVLASGNYPDGVMKRIHESDLEIAKFAPNLSYNHMTDVAFEFLANELRHAASIGVKVFIIDHFQDIKPPNLKNLDDQRKLEFMVTWLAAFAEKRDVCIIVASQENAAGKTKWTTKLTEKAVIWISIKRDILKGLYIYRLHDIDVESLPGQHSPVGKVQVKKVRFGKLGKLNMLYHGPAFDWRDMSTVQRPQFAGKVLSLPGLDDLTESKQAEGS